MADGNCAHELFHNACFKSANHFIEEQILELPLKKPGFVAVVP